MDQFSIVFSIVLTLVGLSFDRVKEILYIAMHMTVAAYIYKLYYGYFGIWSISEINSNDISAYLKSQYFINSIIFISFSFILHWIVYKIFYVINRRISEPIIFRKINNLHPAEIRDSKTFQILFFKSIVRNLEPITSVKTKLTDNLENIESLTNKDVYALGSNLLSNLVWILLCVYIIGININIFSVLLLVFFAVLLFVFLPLGTYYLEQVKLVIRTESHIRY